MKDRCDNCRYWDRLRADQDPSRGFCVRFPAVPLYIENTIKNVWPATHKDNWCGEHAYTLGTARRESE